MVQAKGSMSRPPPTLRRVSGGRRASGRKCERWGNGSADRAPPQDQQHSEVERGQHPAGQELRSPGTRSKQRDADHGAEGTEDICRARPDVVSRFVRRCPLKPGVRGFGFEGQHREDQFVDPPQRFVRGDGVEGGQAEAVFA